MIRHNVLFKVKPIVTDEEIQAAFQILFELKKVLPGFLRMAAGKCRFFENKGSIERLYGFSIDFADENAYNNFLNNPVTDFAKATLINIIVDGYEGIYGFDVGRALDSYPNPLDRYRIPVPRLLPPGAMR
jgi:hypothetical protein